MAGVAFYMQVLGAGKVIQIMESISCESAEE